MALSAGTRLGPYEILSALGAGGMGEVYRARDTRLKRDVALKILPESLASDPERLARFQREAEVLAALNHPHIAAIYGIEESGGTRAIVMELVEGDDLSQRIASGPLPLDEALPIAKQIAEALEAAHERGIVHRDLKPANIKVTPDGTVKVLDFGLAKLAEPSAATTSVASPLSLSPTITSPAIGGTMVGTLLGTAAYMSPEQAKGKPADKRSDIWAFGCVLYEILTGKHAFEGEDVSDTLAAVLRGEPDWTELPPGTPARLRLLLQRCLDKNYRNRLRDIGDARLELEPASIAELPSAGGSAAASSRLSTLLQGAILFAVGIAIGLAATFGRSANTLVPDRPEVRRFLITNVIGVDIDDQTNAIVSPDGRSVVITGRLGGDRGVFVHSVRDGTTREIPGTRSNSLLRPFWSSDGIWLALNINGELRRVALDGRSQTLVPVPNFLGGSFTPNGEIFYSRNSQLAAVSPDTSKERLILDVGSDKLSWGSPQVLPAGGLFLTSKVYASRADIYVGHMDGSSPPSVMSVTGSYPVFVSPDHLLAVREDQLVHWRFDPIGVRVLSGPTILLPGLRSRAGSGTPFSVSNTGVLVAFQEHYATPTRLAWFDRKGTEFGSLALSRPCRNPELSPNGKRVAMECYELSGNRDIWLYDLERDTAQRFTTTPSDDADPLWSPDGTRVAFASTQLGAADVFVKPAGGATKETLLLTTEGSTPTMSWSPDGKYIALLVPGVGFGTFDANAPGGVNPFGSESSNGYYEPQFAPDGRFITYGSIESGRGEVYVQSWPPTGDKVQVSVGGGTDARWNPDGNEIFYLSPDRKLMSVPVKITGGKFEPGRPVPLFQTGIAGPLGLGHRFPYAVSRDGQRFLMYVEDTDGNPAITVILNWPSLLPN